METKKDIRKRVLSKRNDISKKEWEENSRKIQQQVVSHPFFLEADIIYCYVDYRNEVGTEFIIRQAWQQNKKVAVPKIIGDEMEFFYISSFEDLKDGYRGIPEPETELMATARDALVIMPGVVFDKKRNRIGYGKGYYDKYMHFHKKYKTIAIAFAGQLVEQIEPDPFDYRPDVLITEEHIYDI